MNELPQAPITSASPAPVSAAPPEAPAPKPVAPANMVSPIKVTPPPKAPVASKPKKIGVILLWIVLVLVLLGAGYFYYLNRQNTQVVKAKSDTISELTKSVSDQQDQINDQATTISEYKATIDAKSNCPAPVEVAPTVVTQTVTPKATSSQAAVIAPPPAPSD